MLADDVAFVIGVDTHADSHALALVEARTQRTCHALRIQATRAGYRRALRLARRRAPGPRAWALEGTGSYGAGLARFLHARGEQVLEVERPRREGRRGRLKSDALDAERAARSLLQGGGGRPRLGSETQALRALLLTRESAVGARTAALNQLRALLLGAPPSSASACSGFPGRAWSRPARACAAVATRSGRRSRSPCARWRVGSRTSVGKRTSSRRSFSLAYRRSRPSCSPAGGWVPSRRRHSWLPGPSPGGCARRQPSRG